jgi:hypothetical protein
MDNTIRHDSGIVNTVRSRTLLGAKREASREMTYGGGSVTLYYDGEVWHRELWTSGHSFGWGGWTRKR